MGRLPEAPIEVRLAVSLFCFCWGSRISSVRGRFATSPPSPPGASLRRWDRQAETTPRTPTPWLREKRPVDPSDLNETRHRIDRQLLVQDSHVHIPVYAITAALLSVLVFGLRLSSRTRTVLILLLFAAPFLDFVGLWGAHLSGAPVLWSSLAVAGGFAMGAAYLIVLVLVFSQCWLGRRESSHA